MTTTRSPPTTSTKSLSSNTMPPTTPRRCSCRAARVAEAAARADLHPRRVRLRRRLGERGDARRASGTSSPSTSSRTSPTTRGSGAGAEEARTARRAAARGARGGRGQRTRAKPLGEGDRQFPRLSHAEFHWWPNAATSLLIVGAGLVSAWVFCVAFYGRRDRRLVGLTQRVPPLRWALHVRRQQVLPRRPVRGRHRQGHRPPDRQGGVLGQPERHRRHRQRHRRRSASRSARGPTAGSTRVSSTAPSTGRASSPRRAARRCGRCSPARSTSTARCCSAPPPSEPSCS